MQKWLIVTPVQDSPELVEFVGFDNMLRRCDAADATQVDGQHVLGVTEQGRTKTKGHTAVLVTMRGARFWVSEDSLLPSGGPTGG